MLYDKQNQRVRTTKVNSLFNEIAVVAHVLEENKNGNLPEDCHLGSYVTRPGFEPRLAESESDVLPLHYRAIKK